MLSTRAVLAVLLITALSLWVLLYPSFGNRFVPLPTVQAVILDPYDNLVLENYGRYRDALLQNDTAALRALLPEVRGSFLEYRTLLTLARHPEVGALDRAGYYRRALELHLDDPLAFARMRQLWLDYAQTAEEANLPSEAVRAYAEALPVAEAIEGVKRLERNPYTLANIFLEHKQYRNALVALGGLSAPSIEGPAYRALGEYERALYAFERWLAEEPNNDEARFGRAWSLLSLGENTRAEEAFALLTGLEALYGRGILARRAGDIDRAVHFFKESGEPRPLWFLTDILEQEGRQREALEVYLELASLEPVSDYTDDAAHRALVLAERYGDEEAAERARALLPAFSYLGFRSGKSLPLPQGDSLDEDISLPVLGLADALAGVHDFEGAVGELLFALREAEDEATTVAIAEKLQALGEYRQSVVAAKTWLEAGSQNLTTWKLAYPRAYPDIVLAESLQRDLEPELVWAIMRQESAFYPEAVSRSNAKGLMQFIPSTWEWMAELLRESPGDPFRPEDNIRYGAHYLQWLLTYFDGDLELVVPSYNGGQGYIKRLYASPSVGGDKLEFYRFIDKPETRDYLQKAMLNYQVYKLLYNETRLAEESE